MIEMELLARYASKGIEFEHIPADKYKSYHTLHALQDGSKVGEIMWRHEDAPIPVADGSGYTPRAGEIQWVGVNESHQGQGLGRELVQRAHELDPRVHHGRAVSEGGKALVRSMPELGLGR